MARTGFDFEEESSLLECAADAILEGCWHRLFVFHIAGLPSPAEVLGYCSQYGPQPGWGAGVYEIAVGDICACLERQSARSFPEHPMCARTLCAVIGACRDHND